MSEANVNDEQIVNQIRQDLLNVIGTGTGVATLLRDLPNNPDLFIYLDNHVQENPGKVKEVLDVILLVHNIGDSANRLEADLNKYRNILYMVISSAELLSWRDTVELLREGMHGVPILDTMPDDIDRDFTFFFKLRSILGDEIVGEIYNTIRIWCEAKQALVKTLEEIW